MRRIGFYQIGRRCSRPPLLRCRSPWTSAICAASSRPSPLEQRGLMLVATTPTSRASCSSRLLAHHGSCSSLLSTSHVSTTWMQRYWCHAQKAADSAHRMRRCSQTLLLLHRRHIRVPPAPDITLAFPRNGRPIKLSIYRVALDAAAPAITGLVRPVIAVQVDGEERGRALAVSEASWRQPEPDQRPEYETDSTLGAAENGPDPAAALLKGQRAQRVWVRTAAQISAAAHLRC